MKQYHQLSWNTIVTKQHDKKFTVLVNGWTTRA